MQDPKDPEMRAFWASPGWLKLWTALMAGLRHDLTGRVSALHSLSSVASRGLADSEMLTEELARESKQLSTVAQLLEAFPGPASRRDVGVSLAHVAASLPDLLGLASDFNNAEVAVDLALTLPAVVIDPGPARAAILVCIAHALAMSAEGRCSVVAEVETVPEGSEADAAGQVAISVTPSDAGNGVTDTDWMCDETWTGIVGLVAAWEGTCRVDGLARVLTAPTL